MSDGVMDTSPPANRCDASCARRRGRSLGQWEGVCSPNQLLESTGEDSSSPAAVFADPQCRLLDHLHFTPRWGEQQDIHER